MADLRSIFGVLDFTDIYTCLQSGNVVFSSNSKPDASVITKAIKDTLGLDVPVLTLPGSELTKAAKRNPFLNVESGTPAFCYLTFLWETHPKTMVDNLTVPEIETGRFSVSGNFVYVYCPDGYGRTKINNQFFEKKLQVTATTRNWNTVSALMDLIS